jgi:hypothetical protein
VIFVQLKLRPERPSPSANLAPPTCYDFAQLCAGLISSVGGGTASVDLISDGRWQELFLCEGYWWLGRFLFVASCNQRWRFIKPKLLNVSFALGRCLQHFGACFSLWRRIGESLHLMLAKQQIVGGSKRRQIVGTSGKVQLILANHRALKSAIACSRVAEYPRL